jgi:hypothetical protein
VRAQGPVLVLVQGRAPEREQAQGPGQVQGLIRGWVL